MSNPQDNIRPLRRADENAIEKLLPQNIEAEAGVLGSILIDGSDGVTLAMEKAAAILTSGDFYREAHREIYSAALALYQDNITVDLITLTDELARRGKLEEVDGVSYVGSLANQVPSSHNVEYYAQIVKRCATLRHLIAAAGQIAAVAYSEPDSAVALGEASRLLTTAQERAGALGARRFGILSDLELETMRPSKGILGNWIRDKEIVAMYGAAESYKSFLAISMGECWATGSDWFGMPVEQRTVLYIAAEAPGTIGDRVAAWKQHHGMAGTRTEFYTSTLPVDLTSSEEVAALISEIRECLPDAPGAVIIDTYACATSGDEKDATSVNAAYRGMRALRDAFDATIVYVDHEGKDRERGQTGSQRKKDNADVQMHVELIEGSEGMLTVKPVKMKANEKPTPLTLQTKRISFYNDRTQEMRNSLVLVSTSKAQARAVSNEARAEKLSQRQRQSLDALSDLPEGRASYGDWWRKCHGGDPKMFPERTFADCRRALVQAHLVEQQGDIYVSLVRTNHRSSATAVDRTTAVTAVPYIGDRSSAVTGVRSADVVEMMAEEDGQTAPYHRHDPKTMVKRRDGSVVCNDCHPRDGA